MAKVHRVAFRDECHKGTKLTDVYIVENWKRYNNINYEEEKSCCTVL